MRYLKLRVSLPRGGVGGSAESALETRGLPAQLPTRTSVSASGGSEAADDGRHGRRRGASLVTGRGRCISAAPAGDCSPGPVAKGISCVQGHSPAAC